MHADYPHYHPDLLQACLQGSPSDVDAMATKTLTTPNDPDPELVYYVGAILAFCGKKDAAMHLLKTAIGSNYCSYSQLQLTKGGRLRCSVYDQQTSSCWSRL